MEKEEVTAIFKGAVKEARRTVYLFQNPASEQHDLKFSAFEPGLPELEAGKAYKFMVCHVPAGQGKFYHNIDRTSRDGPYRIQEADPKDVPAPSKSPAYGQKEGYWEAKERRDIESEPIKTRLACGKIIAPIVAALIKSGDKAAIKEPWNLLQDGIKRMEKFTEECKT